jgi:hypothetical protein
MATRFVTNLDLVQNQILRGRFQVFPSDPNGAPGSQDAPFTGWVIYNSTEKTLKYYDGTAWQRTLVSIGVAGDSSSALTITNNSDGTVTITPNLATGSLDGVMSAEDKAKLDAATASDSVNTLVMRDSAGRYQAATPVAGLDVANKSYVDSARTGLDVKASVKVATTEAITLSTDLAPGDEIDGYTLVAGDRVLVKNQDSASENGIYVVQADGSVVRATDADQNAEVTPGMFTFVEQGDLNADSGWVMITDGTINLGSTGLEFSLFSVAGNILAGAGLSKTGDVLDVNTDGTSIEIDNDALRIASGAAGDALAWDAGVLDVVVSTGGGLAITSDELEIKLDANVAGLTTTTGGLALASGVAGDGLTFTAGVLSRNVIDLGQGSDDTTGTLPVDQGGTGATTEANARINLGYTTTGFTGTTPVLARISSQAIGNGLDTAYVLTHNFGTRAVIVQIFDTSTYDTVIADVERTSNDTVTVRFSVAPATGAFTAVITG